MARRVSQEREALVAIEKHHGTHKGKLTADKAGTYWLVWDNTYSILKSKSVEYQVYPPTTTTTTSSHLMALCSLCAFDENVLAHHRPYGAGLHQRRHRRRRRHGGVTGGFPPQRGGRGTGTTRTPSFALGDVRMVVLGHHRSWRGWWLFFQLCTAARWRNVALPFLTTRLATCGGGGGGYGRVGKEKPSVAGGLKGRNQRRQPPSPMTCRMFSSRPRSYRFCGVGGLPSITPVVSRR